MMIMSSLKRNGLSAHVAAHLLRHRITRPRRPVLGQGVRVAAVDGHRCASGCAETRRRPAGLTTPKSTPSGNTLPCRTRLRGLCDLVGGDEVQRAEFVVVAPPSPVADIASSPPKVGHVGHGSVLPEAHWRPRRHVSAVDPDHLARNIAGRTAIQEDQHRGLFGGRRKPGPAAWECRRGSPARRRSATGPGSGFR